MPTQPPSSLEEKLKKFNISPFHYTTWVRGLEGLGYEHDQAERVILRNSPAPLVGTLINLHGTFLSFRLTREAIIRIATSCHGSEHNLIALGEYLHNIADQRSPLSTGDLTQILSHSDGVVNLWAINAHFQALQKGTLPEKARKLTTAQIIKIVNQRGGPHNLKALIDYFESSQHDLPFFTTQQLVDVVGHPKGHLNLQAILDFLPFLQSKLQLSPGQICFLSTFFRTKNIFLWMKQHLNVSVTSDNKNEILARIYITLIKLKPLLRHSAALLFLPKQPPEEASETGRLPELSENTYNTWKKQLIELDYKHYQADKIILRASPAIAVFNLIKLHALLKSSGLNHELLTHIASCYKGELSLIALAHYLQNPANQSPPFSPKELTKIVGHDETGADNLQAIITHFQALKEGTLPAQIRQLSNKELIQIVGHRGGANNLKALINYFRTLENNTPPVTANQLTIIQAQQIVRYDQGANNLQALVNHYQALKNGTLPALVVQLTSAHLLKIVSLHGGAANLHAVTAFYQGLNQHTLPVQANELTVSQLVRVVSHDTGEENLRALIHYLKITQNTTPVFSLDKIVHIIDCNDGWSNLRLVMKYHTFLSDAPLELSSEQIYLLATHQSTRDFFLWLEENHTSPKRTTLEEVADHVDEALEKIESRRKRSPTQLSLAPALQEGEEAPPSSYNEPSGKRVQMAALTSLGLFSQGGGNMAEPVPQWNLSPRSWPSLFSKD
ncbi:MAG: hypothetical protein HY939_06740 [Gammaproteobacteria bacterium]|nr:hypothetical protein [Gammaproteobacteria bacterium]